MRLTNTIGMCQRSQNIALIIENAYRVLSGRCCINSKIIEEGMTKDYKEINLIKFHEEFQTEEDCQKKLIKLRWSDGFLCSHCKGKRLL